MKYAVPFALFVLLASLYTFPLTTAEAQIPYRTYRPYLGRDGSDVDRSYPYRNAPRYYPSGSTYARRYRLYAEINRPIHRYRVFPGYSSATQSYDDLLPNFYWPSPIPNAGFHRFGGYRGWGGYGSGRGGWGGYGDGWAGAGVFLRY